MYCFLDGYLYGKKYPDNGACSVGGIIYFCVYIKSASSRQTRHMLITMW